MDLNLETLKGEILDYLAASEFGVFRGHGPFLQNPFVQPLFDYHPRPLGASRKKSLPPVLISFFQGGAPPFVSLTPRPLLVSRRHRPKG